MILDDIVAHKKEEVAARRRAMPVPALRRLPLYGQPRRGFRREHDFDLARWLVAGYVLNRRRPTDLTSVRTTFVAAHRRSLREAIIPRPQGPT